MNKKKNILFSAIAIISVLVGMFSLSFNQEQELFEADDKINNSQIELPRVESSNNEENFFGEIVSPDVVINNKLEEIREKNEEFDYTPKEREWIGSGPFKIDRSEYILGEKIFFTIGALTPMEKGQIVFLNPLNSTHYNVYLTYSFDGSDKPTSNLYFEPSLSKTKGICDISQLVGEWRVVFRGTDYENLEFRITDEIIPGDENDFEPVC